MAIKVQILEVQAYACNTLGHLNATVIDSSDLYKDLCIILDHQLRFHLHTTDVTVRANRLLGLIRKSFNYLDSDVLTRLFTFVCPTLEYSNAVWGPFFT